MTAALTRITIGSRKTIQLLRTAEETVKRESLSSFKGVASTSGGRRGGEAVSIGVGSSPRRRGRLRPPLAAIRPAQETSGKAAHVSGDPGSSDRGKSGRQGGRVSIAKITTPGHRFFQARGVDDPAHIRPDPGLQPCGSPRQGLGERGRPARAARRSHRRRRRLRGRDRGGGRTAGGDRGPPRGEQRLRDRAQLGTRGREPTLGGDARLRRRVAAAPPLLAVAAARRASRPRQLGAAVHGRLHG